MKIDDLEMRLKSLNQKATADDESYKGKYMNTKRALEHLKEDFLRLENEMIEKRQEVRLSFNMKNSDVKWKKVEEPHSVGSSRRLGRKKIVA